MRFFVGKHELHRVISIDLRDERRILREDRDRVGRRSLERAARDQPEVVEERPVHDRHEPTLAHAGDDLIEADGRFDLDAERVQEGGVVCVRIRADGGVRPRRR